MDSPLFIAVVVLLAVAAVWFAYVILRWRFSKRFQEWQTLERQTMEAEREKIRKSAVTQSRSVLGGKFIGTPFDLIIFPGLACGDPREIVIMEIKTGKNCQLSPVERKIRQLIEDGMVRYEFFQPQVEGVDEER
jgi:predicted Holliday junction resolvase-like endonuclease